MSILQSRLIVRIRSFFPQLLWLRMRKVFIALYYVVSKSKSLNKEDVLFSKLIKIPKECFYFEVGSGHYKFHSNTYSLYRGGAKGVVIDANKSLLIEFARKRKRDITVWGAIGFSGSSVKFYQLDPWELSTADFDWYQKALVSGARLVKVEDVPRIEINEIMDQFWPTEKCQTLLSIDIEGLSVQCLKQIDLRKFPFDIIMVEKDSENELPGIVWDFYELIDSKINLVFVRKTL
jgi:hypothetical protein